MSKLFFSLIQILLSSLASQKFIVEKFFRQYNSYDYIGGFNFTNIHSSYPIQLSSTFSYVSHRMIKENEENLNQKIIIKSLTLPSKQTKVNFTFSDSKIVIENYEISIVNRDTLYDIPQLVLGLGYTSKNTDQSLLYLMHKAGEIDQMSFAFEKISRHDTEGRFIFGKTPEELTSGKHKAVVSVDDSAEGWGVKLERVYFNGNNKSYENHYYAYISSENDRIFAPEGVMEYFNKEMFSSFYDEDICWYYEGSEIKYINCLCSVTKSLGNLTFVIDKWEFTLTPEEYFIKISNIDACLFLIQFNGIDPKHDKWLLGSYFFQRYTTEFNFEKKAIIFYSDHRFEKNNFQKESARLPKVILLFTILILIIFTIISLITKFQVSLIG